jgi:hypothetical protein
LLLALFALPADVRERILLAWPLERAERITVVEKITADATVAILDSSQTDSDAFDHCISVGELTMNLVGLRVSLYQRVVNTRAGMWRRNISFSSI